MRPGLRNTLTIAALTALALGCNQRRTLSGELMPCDGASGRHLPYRDVDLGIGARPRAPYVTGPGGREVVIDSAQWRAAWNRFAPSLPLPPMAFHDSIVLLVATRAYASDRRTVRIVDVQRCPSGVIAVLMQTERRYTQDDYGDRTIAAVALDRSLIGNASVHFVDLPDHWMK